MGELARRKDSFDFEYMGRKVKIAMSGNNANLNDYWVGAGRPENKDPKYWLRGKQAKEFIAARVEKLKVRISHLVRIVRGGRPENRGIYVEWQIGIEYARYLSTNYAQQANDAYAEWVEEEHDPALKAERAIKKLEKLGKSKQFVALYLKSVEPRLKICSAYRDHNVSEQKEFAQLTSAGYCAITGHSANELRKQFGIGPKESIKLHFDEATIAENTVMEMWAERLIREKGADGFEECKEHLVTAGRAVKATRDRLFKTG